MTTFHCSQPASPSRVGIYSRFSSDMQRQASIEDQIRTCTECSHQKEWIIDPTFVRSDAGLSGATLATRSALISLINDVEQHRSFDGLVIDDTSRLGRNLGDVLQICALLKFHEVFLYFVNQELDSRDPNFYPLIIQYGAGDEQFLSKLRHTVLRGQKGRILAGMIHGGRYYGYRSEIVPDPSRRGTAGRPAIKGVRLVIDQVQAEIVRLIFGLAEEGRSLQSIAQWCIDHDLPYPVNAARSDVTWTASRIHDILHCELYFGRLIWGRTKGAKNPKTGKIVRKQVPECDWTVVEVPELTIISKEQWERVQSVIASRKSFGIHRLGGVGRSTLARVHLFSGMLECGLCKGPIVVTGCNDQGARIYQCRNYRFRRTCKNKFAVLSSVLEEALVSHVAQIALQPEFREFSVQQVHQRFKSEMEKELEEVQKRKAIASELQQEKRQLDIAIQNIINSLREYGSSSALLQELRQLEARCSIVQTQMETPVLSFPKISVEEVRGFVERHASHLAETLKGDRVRAREAIRRHFAPLILTPELRGSLPVYRIDGGIQFQPDQQVNL